MAAAPLISFACRALQLPYATLRVPTTGPCRKDARASFAYTYVSEKRHLAELDYVRT